VTTKYITTLLILASFTLTNKSEKPTIKSMIHSFIHSSYTKHLHTAKQVCQQDAYPQYTGVQLKLCATLRPATFPFAD